MSKTNKTNTTTIDTSLLINGEMILKSIFDKNPFNIEQTEKNIAKFAKNALAKYNVIVFFQGILRNHEDIIQHKYRLLNEFHKKRQANAKKLCSESDTIASLLLSKYGVKVLFSDELNLVKTLHQYALHDINKNTIVVSKVAHKKLADANSLFKDKIVFYDNIWMKDNEIKFNSSINFKEGKYYTKDEEQVKVVDSITLESWKSPIEKSTTLPKCLDNYRDVKLNSLLDKSSTFILGSKAFMLNELGNPYLTLTKLRQSLYHNLKLDTVIEEVMEYFPETNEYQFIPYVVKSDGTKVAELNYSPDKLYKLIFHNLEKTSNALFTEFNNQVCSAYSEVCLIQCLANKLDFVEIFKKGADKVKPIEKVILEKVCLTCEKKFKMKESELEIYKIRDLTYPSNCQSCIDERAVERKIKEEMEKNMASYNKEQEAIQKEQK